MLYKKDFPKCDLLIVIGTSLTVAPFCELVNFVDQKCPRVLINLDDNTKYFNCNKGERDLGLFGDLQINIVDLVNQLNWKEDLLGVLSNDYDNSKIKNYFQ